MHVYLVIRTLWDYVNYDWFVSETEYFNASVFVLYNICGKKVKLKCVDGKKTIWEVISGGLVGARKDLAYLHSMQSYFSKGKQRRA